MYFAGHPPGPRTISVAEIDIFSRGQDIYINVDILLSTADNTLYIIELTVGFETNLDNNAHRKELKYRPLLTDLAKDYNKIKFVNLCISCLGIFGNSSDSFLQMCNERGIENHDLRFIISKLSTIIIRTTYYIFCMRNKAWCDPEILNY